MSFGICHLSVVPVRAEPSDKSEMVSQLLFGEIFEVAGQKEKWVRVIGNWDKYEGWIDHKQWQALSAKVYKKLAADQPAVSLDLVRSATRDNTHIPIIIGSTLPQFDGLNFKLNKEKYIYNGQAISQKDIKEAHEVIKKCALKYLNAPYLWGGRTPFGIDCSGYTQVVYKIIGVPLPRDAYQQAEHGRLLNFIHEVQTGDLVFFDNEEGNITHTGIILNPGEIIHASGKVRIDTIDHYGIYNKEDQKYTHKLRLIRRLL